MNSESARWRRAMLHVRSLAALLVLACGDADSGAGPSRVGEPGLIAYTRNVNGVNDLFAAEPDGSSERNLSNTPNEQELVPAWSPDGRTIAYTKVNPTTGKGLFLMDADGDNVRRVPLPFVPPLGPFAPPEPLTGGMGNYMSWSPDGRRLVFDAYTLLRGRELFMVNIDGSGFVNFSALAALKAAIGEQDDPDWSPDGRHIVFSAIGGIYLVDASGGQLRHVTVGYLPAWSPDGRRLAFSRSGFTAEGREFIEVYIVNADGTGVRNLTQGRAGLAISPVWSPDGRWIAFTSAPADHSPDPLAYHLRLVSPEGVLSGAILHGSVQIPSWARR